MNTPRDKVRGAAWGTPGRARLAERADEQLRAHSKTHTHARMIAHTQQHTTNTLQDNNTQQCIVYTNTTGIRVRALSP